MRLFFCSCSVVLLLSAGPAFAASESSAQHLIEASPRLCQEDAHYCRCEGLDSVCFLSICRVRSDGRVGWAWTSPLTQCEPN